MMLLFFKLKNLQKKLNFKSRKNLYVYQNQFLK